jgi:hypothetical protein
MPEKNAYSTPLIVCTLNVSAALLRVIAVSTRAPERYGSIAWMPLVFGPAVIANDSVVPFQAKVPNDDELRPSSQFSICRLETTGTPRAVADAITVVDSGMIATSVWALTV